MLVRTLIAALDHAYTPLGVQFATWGLEKVTGIRTTQLLELRAGGEGAEYYQRNGFYQLAARHGYRSSSYSGKTVTVDSAMELSAVYACVKIIAEDIGSLPFFAYERSNDGKTLEKAYSHPLYRILHDQPNPEMSSGEFRETLTAHAALGCDGFARIERARTTGKLVYLWPFEIGTVESSRNSNNQLVYIHKKGTPEEKTYRREEIFHVKGFTLDGVTGDKILHRARHILGLGEAAQEYAARFFAQDASPGVILQRPAGAPGLGPEAVTLVKKAWKEWHQGLHRAHEPAVLQDGTEAVRLDPDHQKLQLLESRRFQLIEVARLYRMPLHKLADLERSTNNNIEHQGIEYTTSTLLAPRRRWEEAVHRCLLSDEEKYWPNGRPRMYAEMNVESLLRGDFKTQTEGWAKLLEKGVIEIDTVRGWLNLNPTPGGDVPHIQLNMQTVADAAKAGIAEQQQAA